MPYQQFEVLNFPSYSMFYSGHELCYLFCTTLNSTWYGVVYHGPDNGPYIASRKTMIRQFPTIQFLWQ